MELWIFAILSPFFPDNLGIFSHYKTNQFVSQSLVRNKNIISKRILSVTISHPFSPHLQSKDSKHDNIVLFLAISGNLVIICFWILKSVSSLIWCAFNRESFLKSCKARNRIEVDRKGFETWRNMSKKVITDCLLVACYICTFICSFIDNFQFICIWF